MGKFSKKDKVSEFFQNMMLDTEKERNETNPKLSDFTKYDDDFKTGTININFEPSKNNSEPLMAIKSKVQKIDDDDIAVEEQPQENVVPDENATLLEKCKPYTHDEEGNDFSVDDSPIYELKSIADILKSDSIGALEQLSKKYNVKITDETKYDYDIPDSEIDENTDEPTTETAGETIEDSTEKAENDSVIKMDSFIDDTPKSDDEIYEDYLVQNSQDTENDTSNDSIPDISDIDNAQKFNDSNIEDTKEAVLKFVPVADSDSSKKRISVSSITGKFDTVKVNTGTEKQENTWTKLENDDFDDYEAKTEIVDFSKIKSAIIDLSHKKRTRFLCTGVSALCLITLLINRIPAIFDLNLSNPKNSLIMLLAVSALDFIVNIDSVLSFKNFFNKFSKPDISSFLANVSVLTVLIFQIIKDNTDFFIESFYLSMSLCFILFVRSLFSFYDVSTTLSNLKIVSGKNSKKNALTFIDDASVTFAMAKNSIDGDILITAPRKTHFIKDFIKFDSYRYIQNGRFAFFQFIGILLSVASAVFGTLFFDNFILGLFCSSIILCILSFPTVFLINTLPLMSAAKKLNADGAMINGLEGAAQIETSNATVISSTELFPEGSIILKDLKILSENSIDDTILRAASLTEAVDSTLAPVFKQIAKTNSKYVLPDSDTVKYEERLGLSGWVDNELLFIGNRTLLESHGIEVPSIEYDKQILKRGFFPVYLATVQKACALLIIKYEPSYDITKKIRKLSRLGVTILIDNHDPNINEEMISDYFGVYADTLKIMSNSGLHMYKKATAPVESCVAPAAFKYDNLAIVNIINTATSIIKSNSLLTVLYTVFTVLCATGFIYSVFSQRNSVPSTLLLFAVQLATTIISLLLYLFKKP